MGKYLKRFNSETEYDSFKNGQEYIEPNVCVIGSTPKEYVIIYKVKEYKLEFPIYLNWDYCEDHALMKTCVRNGDELSKMIFNYLYPIALQYGDTWMSEENLDELGIEIYIDDEKIIEVGIDNQVAPGHKGLYLNTPTSGGGGIYDVTYSISLDFFIHTMP